MPIKVQNNLPAKLVLENENIFTMDENRAMSQDIRPLKIAILNLMPLKEDTEVQILRQLSNTPLQLDLTFLTTASYIGHHTALSHLEKFYETYADVKDQRFDGLIITGAPVEQMEFEEVAYWEELTKIMEWSKTNVTSTLHLCWGSQAGLYYHYGIKKYELDEKLFGIYSHHLLHHKDPLVRGFDDFFYAPQSRYTYNRKEDIAAVKDLKILAESDEAGVFLVRSKDAKQVFVTGHLEYDRLTLDREYKRDVDKGLEIEKPANYYPGNDAEKVPYLTWRCHCNALYCNWINYFVYQNTPYEW